MEQPQAWFALTVSPRHEKAAAHNLRLRGLEEFLPLYRVRRAWSDRMQVVDVPLFPGYVFCRFSYGDRLHALQTPGVKSVVGFGTSETPLDDSEIAAVRRLIASGLPITPWPYLRVGDMVHIERGALEGVRGTVLREKGPWRLVVTVELLQRSVAVEIDRELLSPFRGGLPTSTCQQQLSC
jgi:transcription termination/antitermination protein NusG